MPRTIRRRQASPARRDREASPAGCHRVAAFTLVEVMTVVLIITVVATLLLFGIQGAREAARRAECLSNIRQLTLAAKEYAGHYRVLPSVHTNVWALLADETELPCVKGVSAAAFPLNRNDLIPGTFRCGTDMLRLSTAQGCSYAPNFQEAYNDRPDESPPNPPGAPPRDEYNWQFTPWSNFKLDASGNPVISPSGLLGVRDLSDAANDTILLVECWNSQNRIDVTAYTNTPFPPLTGYREPGAAEFLRTSGDARAYRVLSAFAERAGTAANDPKTYAVKRQVYHRGQMCVGFADLHAESAEASRLTLRPPKDVPAWTRAAD